MKKHLFILNLILSAVSLWAGTTPTAQDLTAYYRQGQVCICMRFEGAVCSDIVWCGTYNNWATGNVSSLAKFQPVQGFGGWYVVAFDDNSQSVNGKAVQLKLDGSFDWQYQTGGVDSWEIISGSCTPTGNTYSGESDLNNIGKSTPLIIVSKEWKNELCPPEPGKSVSGTLPVLYINTKNGQAITSKDDYVKATYYLIGMVEGVKDVASPEQPDTMQIKGHGNYTWRDFDKKPYRLKLDSKTALIGMKKNKHWNLLAHADDSFGWMKNTCGFFLSEQIGLKWTPKQQPVEVVLNNDYIGLYMLTEKIRVEKDRVNILEQPDEFAKVDSVSGGWLVEIDNYEEEGRIELWEPENKWHGWQKIMITPNTPEVLSQVQRDYLTKQMNDLNDAIYGTSETTLTDMLDMDEAAKFYLVQELMSDCESYHGSCYLYKDFGSAAKWFFGPVWDFGNSFNDRDMFIYDNPAFSQVWIGQLASHTSFQQALSKVWKHWKYYDYEAVADYMSAFADQIEKGAKADATRWPQYDHHKVQDGKNSFINMFNRHVAWLTKQWGEGEPDPVTELEVIDDARCTMHNAKFIRDGQFVIIKNGRTYNILGL